MDKNGDVQQRGKVVRSNATPIKLFSVDSYGLKFMSLTFCNDIVITFEMPRSSFLMSFWKTNISLLFHQSVFRGPSLGLFRSFCLLNCYKERKNTVVLPGNFFFRPSMLCETFLQKQFKFKSFFCITSNICAIIKGKKCLRFHLCTII